jgi:hypothetical protein
MKTPKRMKISVASDRFKEDADALFRGKYYAASILYNAVYVEHLLLSSYLFLKRDGGIQYAISARDDILKRKEKGWLPFGEVIKLTVPALERFLSSQPKLNDGKAESLLSLCRKLNKIRNEASVHPYLALMLDPSNQEKKAMYDVNYYRKVLRKIKIFLEKDLGVAAPSEVERLIKVGSPMSMLRLIDEEFASTLDEVERIFASSAKEVTSEIRSRLKVLVP